MAPFLLSSLSSCSKAHRAPPHLPSNGTSGTGSNGGDIYTGLDRFGQLIETIWKPTSGANLVQSSYGRNRFGGVVWRRDDAAHDMVKLMNSTAQTNGDTACKILIGVCSARKNKALREGIRSTWLSRPKQGIEVLFFVGDGTGRLDEEPDTLALPAADTYDALPAKVQAFFGEALRTPRDLIGYSNATMTPTSIWKDCPISHAACQRSIFKG